MNYSNITITYSGNTPPPPHRGDEILSRCYLCGKSQAQPKLEKEHVLPKTYFKLNPPIVLRACHKCNHNKGLVDNQFALEIQSTSFTNLAAAQHHHAVTEKFKDKKHAPLRQEYFANKMTVPMYTSSNLYVGKTNVLKVNKVKQRQYITLLAKGLWTANMKRIFNWDNYYIQVDTRQIIQDKQLINADVIQHLLQVGLFRQRWEHIFEYVGANLVNVGTNSTICLSGNSQQEYLDSLSSMWVLQFYDSHISVVTFYHKKSPFIEVLQQRIGKDFASNGSFI